MARIKHVAVSLCIVALLTTTLLAAPDKERQTVYLGHAHDGQGYGGRFYPRAEHTLYLLAGVPNVLVPRVTEVYWWPITREYKADWEGTNEALAGTLEAGGRAVSMTAYSLRYDGGYESARTGLIVGDDSARQYAAYQQALVDYRARSRAYTEQRAEFDLAVERWGAAMAERQQQGQSSADLPPPAQPQKPEQVSVIVTEPEQGFVVTLPAGTHQLQLRSADGKVVPGSQRTVVAFSHRREGVAYKVIAASKWTRPETSVDPADNIYVSGEKALYIQPAAEREYDAFFYAKLLNPQQTTAQDRRGQWTWAPAGAFPGSKLALLEPGQPARLIEKRAFYVQQTPGGALGYDILPLDLASEPKAATFEAFEVRPPGGAVAIEAPGAPGSRREILVVRPGMATPSLALAVLPLAAGLAWAFWRRWSIR